MTGRRVLVDGAYFGNPHDNPYPGLVYKWTSYHNEQNKKLWGYDIHYDEGDEYYMLEKDVLRFLVPINESTLGIYPTPTIPVLVTTLVSVANNIYHIHIILIS